MSIEPPHAPTPRRSRSTLTGVVGAAVAVTAIVSLAGPVQAEPAPITVTVDASADGGRTIPAEFLGLSWEADQLHKPWMGAESGNLATLLRDLGPGTMRFSANAVDSTPWRRDAPADTPGPVITAADLARAGGLARATGWPIDLGVNLHANNPAAAADEVHTARAEMGAMLRSVQIGNEPNAFPLVHLQPYDPPTYLAQVRAYRQAIDAATPGVRYAGPDAAVALGASPVAKPIEDWSNTWNSAYLDAFAQQGDFLNQHYYPLLRTPGANTAAMVDQLDSAATADADRAFITGLVSEAAAAKVEPHLSETNSVAGNGQPGVSNTFGAALWTVNYLLTAASSGIAGVNMHQQPQDCGSYTWVCMTEGSDQLHAQPPFYAGLLVSQLRGGTFLPTQVSDPAANVSAYGLRMPDGKIKVVVDDLGGAPHRTISVRVKGSNSESASAQWLSGASPYATSGVRFANAEVATDGSFAPAAPQRLSGAAGDFDVDFNGPAAVVLDI